VSYLSKAHAYFRFASELKTFLREPISVEAAQDYVRRRMETRAAAFLTMVERAIFADSTSPYLKLFRAAGCELGDVKNLVERNGIEETLAQLLKAGIYVTYDEFKGRAPAARGSRTFVFRAADFDNPLITTHFHSSSGGTRGWPTPIRVNLDHIAQSAPHWALWFAAHDWMARPLVFWTTAHAGVANRHLLCAKFGKRFVQWFGVECSGTLRDRIVAAYLHRVVRRAAGFPKPIFVPLSEISKIGAYLITQQEKGALPCVVTTPSAAARLAVTMQSRGLSLRGVTFLLGAEPLTTLRRQTIEASGAAAVPTYGFAEGGSIGSQCPNPSAADDIHVSLDAYAVIPRARAVDNGETVNALLLTALRPACPKIILNAEIGDYAALETRRCGCFFDDVGYFTHLHTIRSFEKLTGEGVTFLGGELFNILEEVLPQKFGGAVGDYQLVEEQDGKGLPRYSILVNPELGPLDETALAAVFLEQLGRRGGTHRFMANQWERAGVLQVKRRRPLATARGKVLPFRTLGAP
jgi:hypothetical protein